MTNKLNYNYINPNRREYKIKETLPVGYFTMLIIIVIATLSTPYFLYRAIEIHNNNQMLMLCESAKLSGNEVYLPKCECYYKTNVITCIKGDKNVTK